MPRTQAREIDTCARCHARAERLSDDEPHGKPPLDTHRLSLLDSGLYWDDGQMRDEVYNWGSFAQSKMFAKGVTCSDCHDPHSLKLRAPGNAVCAQCHQPGKYDAVAHTRHAAGTAGAACAACHMPTTTYMVIDPRHDHSMRIPRPDLSVKLGTPNACNNCHTGKTPQWAANAIAQWTGKNPGGYQRFAEAFAAGSAGALEARRALIAIIDDREEPPIVRASALSRIERWLTPGTLPKVTNALNDPDPIVRLAAVEALSTAPVETRQQYLPRMLQDPVRAIRVDAAHALAGPGEAGLRGADRAAFDRAIEEFVAVQSYNADRPEGRTSLANLYALRGEAERAITEYRKAIELDPTFIQAYANLADLYRARGSESESEAALRAGLARNPAAAALHYALGLSLTRQKRTAEAVKEFAEAARLDPAHPRYAYVYAVAQNDSGHPREALQTLERGAQAQPVRPRRLVRARDVHGSGRRSRNRAAPREAVAGAGSGKQRIRAAHRADREQAVGHVPGRHRGFPAIRRRGRSFFEGGTRRARKEPRALARTRGDGRRRCTEMMLAIPRTAFHASAASARCCCERGFSPSRAPRTRHSFMARRSTRWPTGSRSS